MEKRSTAIAAGIACLLIGIATGCSKPEEEASPTPAAPAAAAPAAPAPAGAPAPGGAAPGAAAPAKPAPPPGPAGATK
jgi:hypothetical protein